MAQTTGLTGPLGTGHLLIPSDSIEGSGSLFERL